MSDITPILTQQIAGQNPTGHNGPLQGNGTGVFAPGQLFNFFDMLLGLIGEGNEANGAQRVIGEDNNAAPANIQADTKNAGLNANGTADQEHTLQNLGAVQTSVLGNTLLQALHSGSKFVSDGSLAAAPEQNLSQAAPAQGKGQPQESAAAKIGLLNKLAARLNAGLPQEAQPDEAASLAALLARLESNIADLRVRLEQTTQNQGGQDSGAFSTLIALGLSPAQLTQVTQRLQTLEDKLGRTLSVEDLIAGIGGLLTQGNGEGENGAAFGVALQSAGQQDGTGQNAKHADAAAGAQTDTGDIQNGHPAAAGADKAQTGTNTAGGAQNNGHAGDSPSGANANSEIAAKGNRYTPFDVSAKAGGSGGANNPNIGAAAGAQTSATELTQLQSGNAGGTAFPNSTGPGSTGPGSNGLWSFFAPGLWGGASDGLALGLAGYGGADALIAMDQIQAGLPLTQALQAAHLTTQVQQAGHPHPGTQLVAATLHKTAQGGVDKSLTLRLDPPELGRVNVRLEFGPDKSVKTHLLVEKPETYLMLQRDAALLEKALENAGLDPDGSGLSFELAEDGSAFEQQDKDRANGHSGQESDTAGTQDEDEAMIETTMSWHVDPETGHARYNLLV